MVWSKETIEDIGGEAQIKRLETEKEICECGHHITSHYGGNDMSCKHQDCYYSKNCKKFKKKGDK